MVIFNVWIVFISSNKKLESHKKVCENKDFCNLVMPKDVKVLDFNQNQKSDKAGIIIYADLECVI